MDSKTQVQFANEGAEKKQKEEEVAARKRKLEEKEKWEGKSHSACHIYLYCEILRVFLADRPHIPNLRQSPLSALLSRDQTLTLVLPFPVSLLIPICLLISQPISPQQNAEKSEFTIGEHSKSNLKRKRRMNMFSADSQSAQSASSRLIPRLLRDTLSVYLPCCEYYIPLCNRYLTSFAYRLGALSTARLDWPSLGRLLTDLVMIHKGGGSLADHCLKSITPSHPALANLLIFPAMYLLRRVSWVSCRSMHAILLSH